MSLASCIAAVASCRRTSAGVVGRREALERDDAADEQKGGVERPVVVAEHHADGRADADHQRVAERGDREAGVEQRADAEDRSGENAEKQRVLLGRWKR